MITFSVIAIVIGLVLVSGAVLKQTPAPAPLLFGVDLQSVAYANKKGVPLGLGSFWVGSWSAKQGWGYAEGQLRAAKQNGVTPVVHWWYWGDDISPACIEQGCHDGRQNVQKDKATWFRLAEELSRIIEREMGDRETIVVLESEFNKGGTEDMEAFDGYLAQQAALFHSRGNVKVVLGFGSWGQPQWSRFDRAAAASDYIGLQLLRSSVRDADSYLAAIETLLSGARHIQKAFKKPSFVVDLALSSYPAASYESRQASVVKELFTRMPELKAAGVRAVVYRMFADDAKFDRSNYHGVAERHWGFVRSDGSEKPAFAAFAAGVRQERGRLGADSE